MLSASYSSVTWRFVVPVSSFGGGPFRSGVVHHGGRMSPGGQPLRRHHSLHLCAHRGQVGVSCPSAPPPTVPTSPG